MPITIRVLGQSAPASATETALYTCATTSAVISTLAVCNRNASAGDTFAVRINIGGAGDSDQQLLFSATPIPAATSLFITIGATLAANDVVKVTSTNGYCSFSAFGQENS